LCNKIFYPMIFTAAIRLYFAYSIVVFSFFFSNIKLFAQEDYALLYKQFQEAKQLNNHFYGFALYDMDENRYVLDINANKYFTPASNTKIFTTQAVLAVLGDSIPGIYYVERGDSLIFWAAGDPSFLHSKLDTRRVYNFLKNSPKKLFYAPNIMLGEVYRPGWILNDYEAYFQPEIACFPIYGNVVTFRRKPDGSMSVVPAHFSYRVDAARYNASGKFSVRRAQHRNDFYTSSAHIPAPYVNEIPYISSDSLAVQLLQDTLHRAVQMIAYQKPEDVQVLHAISTRVLLREMMLPSDNFLAEQLMMICAVYKYGTFDVDRLRKELYKTFYHKFSPKIELYDASGLSFYNKVTPQSLVETLLDLVRLEPNEQTRLSYFPSGGVDGTIRSAYNKDQNVPFIWAKTGTITNVYCQSGYLHTRKGKRFIFSFMNNNFLDPVRPVRDEMVAIMTFLRKNY